MITNEVNPVTENEMRNFAERMVTSFVSLSEQAKELVAVRNELNGLRSEINYQKDRLEAVLNENSSLQSQIQTVVAERDNARREQADNLALAKQYEQERDEARHRVQRLQETVTHKERAINDLHAENDRLRKLASNTELELATANAKLTKLQDHFKSVFEPEAKQADANPPVQAVAQSPEPQKRDDYIPF